jgi:4-amino-4-deoxy-L-arabinose transferase-like glycosyltransferase
MILIFPIALAIAAIILWRSRGQSGSEGRGCRWFWAWSIVGAGLALTFLTGFSIGFLLLPFALLLLWLVVYLSPRWPESIGFIEGSFFL